MIPICFPEDEEITLIQEHERAYYWSNCVEGFLRKHGLIGIVCTDGGEVYPHFSIITRGAASTIYLNNYGFLLEGSQEAKVYERLQIETTTAVTEQLVLSDVKGDYLGTLCYPTLTVRAIPKQRGERSEPFPFHSSDPFWNNQVIQFRKLFPGKAWKPIAWAKEEGGEPFVAVVSDGCRMVCGLPLFDLIGQVHAFPPLDYGYFQHTRSPNLHAIEAWLIGQIRDHAIASGCKTVEVARWPSGKSAALTVRHDYDRPINDGALSELLTFYSTLRIKASWSFLVNNCPVTQIHRIHEAGHEINLHTVATDFQGFCNEVATIEQRTGVRPVGSTSHGGMGSLGYAGERQFIWAEQGDMLYGELLGRDNGVGHRVNRICADRPIVSRLMVPPTHWGLDAGTRPDAHHLSVLVKEIPRLIARGDHVNLMNHPDIHVAELKTLLQSLDLSSVWLASFERILRWIDVTKYRSWLECIGSDLKVCFPEPVSEPFELIVYWNNGKATQQVAVGDRSMGISLDAQGIPQFVGGTGNNKRQAVLHNDIQNITADLGQYAEFMVDKPFHFTTTSKLLGFPFINQEEVGNFLYPLPVRFFDRLFLGKSLRLFANRWGKAFLVNLGRALQPGGTIIMPVFPDREAQSKGYWSLRLLAELCGEEAIRAQKNGELAEFRIGTHVEAQPSTLEWFYRSVSNILFQTVQFWQTSGEIDLEPLCSEVLLPGYHPERLRGPLEVADYPILLGANAYYMWGVSYKSAVMQKIVEDHCGVDTPIKFCDLGGGYGLLAMELLLDPQLRISKVVNCDMSHFNLFLAAQLYRDFVHLVEGRFFAILTYLEDFLFDDTYDVISLVGALLYVTKAKQMTVLQRAWDALRPGGILVVQENIKNPAFDHDYNKMFTVEELEGMLKPFGEIEYYLSTATRKIDPSQVGERTVFRVLQKR